MPLLKNTNPMGQVDVPILGRQGAPFGKEGAGCLEPGEEFETTDEIAGSAPTTNKAGEVTDPGTGLLAQSDNYSAVTKKKG